MQLTIDNERLRSLIPGIIHEVPGEASLYDKLSPWLESEYLWLESIFFVGYEPGEDIADLAERIIAHRAFARAIPSLDVTLSPAGFAVIDTEGRSPASKERVERLIKSLNDFADENLVLLSNALLDDAEWRKTMISRWWLSTCIPSLGDVAKYVANSGQSLMDVYNSSRNIAELFESALGYRYIGDHLLANVHKATSPELSPTYYPLWERVHAATCRIVSDYMETGRLFSPRDVWREATDLIRFIKASPDLALEWEAEMGENFKVEPFVNNRKGGFFF